MDLFSSNNSKYFWFAPALGGCNFHHFIPALVGKPVSDLERSLFALPVRLGGLGICDPRALANSEFAASVKVTQPLVNCILHQQGTFNTDIIVCQRQAKAKVVALKREHQSTSASALKSVFVCWFATNSIVCCWDWCLFLVDCSSSRGAWIYPS